MTTNISSSTNTNRSINLSISNGHSSCISNDEEDQLNRINLQALQIVIRIYQKSSIKHNVFVFLNLLLKNVNGYNDK